MNKYSKFTYEKMQSEIKICFCGCVKKAEYLFVYNYQQISKSDVTRKSKTENKIRALLLIAKGGARWRCKFTMLFIFHFIYFRKFVMGGNTELPFDLYLFCFYFYLAL